jgi:hypothetical protein
MNNERVQQLAERAGIEWDDKYHYFVSAASLRLFAQSVAYECADYFGREGDRRFEVDGNWIAETIKRNFGL